MFPLEQPVAIFSVVLFVILLGPFLFRVLKVPQTVGMILAGIAIGPYGFNILARDASFVIFGEVGILYIMFLAAVEIDMFHLQKQYKRGIIFGLISFVLPMLGGIYGAHYIMGVSWLTSLLIASMFASHTLISYPTVSKFGLSNNRGAVVAVCGTIVAVLLALLTLAEVINVRIHGGFSLGGMVKLLVLMSLYMATVGYSFPWLTRRVFSRNNDPTTQYIFILALVFVAGFLAKLIGLEAILGAFYAGLVLNPMIPSRSGLMRNLKFVGYSIFIPYFLIGVGMLINVQVIFNGWGVCLVALSMTAVALGTKLLATVISCNLFRFSHTEGWLIFGLTSGKAAATIAATMIGYKYGLLSEDIMNGAVVMILICCIVASVVTERASKRIRLGLTADELNTDELHPAEFARQLVAVVNPVTSEGLMRMAMFMRNPNNKHYVTALYVRTSEDPRQKAMGQIALRAARTVAENMDIEVKSVERYDLNIVSGLVGVSIEEDVTELIIGLHRKSNIVDTFYGTLIEQLLKETNRMIFMSRCFIPIDTVNRIVLVAPEKSEFETGFQLWVTRLANMGAWVGARLIFVAYPGTADYIRAIIEESGLQVRHDYRIMLSWDDFILLAGEINEDDLMVVVSARKGSLSYCSDLESVPQFLNRHFSRHNLMVVYPKQF